MAKFIKSKFQVLWGTVFAFFYGLISPVDLSAQEDSGQVEEGGAAGSEASDTAEGELKAGAIAAAVAAAAAILASASRKASKKAKNKNPKLKRVK